MHLIKSQRVEVLLAHAKELEDEVDRVETTVLELQVPRVVSLETVRNLSLQLRLVILRHHECQHCLQSLFG